MPSCSLLSDRSVSYDSPNPSKLSGSPIVLIPNRLETIQHSKCTGPTKLADENTNERLMMNCFAIVVMSRKIEVIDMLESLEEDRVL
jgi:hypothetical protein